MKIPSLAAVRRSRFVGSVAILSSGQLAAVAIPFLAAPILGRLYAPRDYGIIALYIAFAAVLAGASTLQFQNGVFAVGSPRKAQALAGLSIVASLVVAIVAAVVAIGTIAYLGQSSAYGPELDWLLLLPLTTVASAIVLTGDVMMNRYRRYRTLAWLQVAAAGVNVATAIALGLRGWGASGVMAGYFAGEAVRTAGYVRILGRLGVRPFSLGLRMLGRVARRHRDYPRFTLPAMLVSSAVLQMPFFVLSCLGATALLGALGRTQRLVAMPLILVGTSIGQVFRQRAAEEWRATGDCRRIYRGTALLLAALGLPTLVALVLWGPAIFAFVLGPDWEIAGQIARILAPMLFLRMIASPLEGVFQFTGNQRAAFRLNIASLALILLGTLGPVLAGLPAMAIVWGFAISSGAAFLASLVLSWRCARPRIADAADRDRGPATG